MIKHFLRIALITLAGTQVAVALSAKYWFFELFTHWPHYYILAGLLLLALMIWKRMWASAIITILIIAMNLAIITPYLDTSLAHPDPYAPENQIKPVGTELSLLTSNFYVQNTDQDAFKTLLDQERPDIFIIHEASDIWQQDPESTFGVTHPFQYKTEISGIRGIFMASKIQGQFRETPLGDYIGIEFTPELDSDQTPYKILAVHPQAPITADYAKERNQQFKDIAAYTQYYEDQGYKIIISGDFNSTPFSPYFQEMLEKSGLHDARLGFGLIPTWHSTLPIFRIPIDHSLVSPELIVEEFRTTTKIPGSDHLPILLRLIIPEAM